MRYISPKNGIFLAELQFWGKDKQGKERRLEGIPITYIANDSISKIEPEKAFDNDIRTNFNAPAGSWIGLDLQSNQFIDRIKYLPRNNFNVIELNNKYELMYYNQGWKSLGIKTAANQFLEYEDVPRNALFLLRNITQGKEERIFTYEDEKQVWW